MLQNRVDPWGNIIATSARGSWMGNRGLLHNEHQRIRRSFRLKAWLICRLEFKGRKRPVMAPRQYTELFFLDEATAFSAGHRPCFECRREDANRFKSFWIKGNPEYDFDAQTLIGEIDEVIHKERIDRDGSKISYEEKSGDLPNGCFVSYNNTAFVISDTQMFPWSPFGYGQGVPLAEVERVKVLTPKSVVNAFRAGYVPQMAIDP
jgi:hypothetical protein